MGLSETRRTGSSEINSKGFTYYWSGMSNGHHVKGIDMGISNRLQPSIIEVTSVDGPYIAINAGAESKLYIYCCSTLLQKCERLKRCSTTSSA